MMRLLLDTCTVYWWDRGTDVTDDARHAIENANETFISAASAREIMTKWRSGKQPEFAGLATIVTPDVAFNQYGVKRIW
jgi:PIN domain nuclease of toxin-antitoxin system